MRQRLAILGSTGSIGVNTLEVAALHPDSIEVYALTAARNVDLMLSQCVRFSPRIAVMADPDSALKLKRRCAEAGLKIDVEAGADAITALARHPEVDTVMAAIVGAAGLEPCMAAARSAKKLLLANKEALVVGGPLFMDAVHKGGATLLPIDSEHSAIFQSLPPDPSQWSKLVDKLILTASGGPFRTRDPATLAEVTPEMACAHPNWVMGRKISVDSASMMNKALEVIEAHFLFGMPPERIEAIIHPQSVIHSMVQFVDNSVVAQLGTPDMRGPIAYGLSWPGRITSGATAINFSTIAALTFEPADRPDHRLRYPGLGLAWRALREMPGSTAVLNAANEVAVDAFLQGQIRFDRIYQVNLQTMDQMRFAAPQSVAELIDLDQQSRAMARDFVRSLAH